ncbi:hypothetical protein RhiirA4_471268 [Rhizophagus irregularis]|uniref:F-box domain-containing protein n=1 Tax=Rhizophagus irregularis TaxID=588596 RepID=A0A2I1H2Z5_9GLOM|nr:hypothetical protein RhiirA4_471268 [Rhizophagus irregularis]
MSKLPADCLFEIFEFLANDKESLYSCLLVNKLWSTISVRILWRDSTNYNFQTLKTLIKCLPNESKEIISKTEIDFSISISKPMFNYPSFCKILLICEIHRKFESLFPSPENLIKNYTLIEIYKLFMNITELKIFSNNISFSFIKNFINLINFQVLELENYDITIDVFEKLSTFIFPHLKIFKIDVNNVNYNFAIKFLMNNGKNLRELSFCEIMGENDNLLNLTIAKFCVNLKVLSIGFFYDELETFKIILNSCKHLETIKIWLDEADLLYEKVALETIANYSPENMNRIELLYFPRPYTKKLLSEELDSFFINWSKRVPYIPITIIINRFHHTKSLDTEEENLNIIDKYIRSKVIKKFIVSIEKDEGELINKKSPPRIELGHRNCGTNGDGFC